MNVDLLTMPTDKAKKEFALYENALKKGRKEDYLEELRNVYKYMAQGKKIINIYSVFADLDLNTEKHPKLGIVKADTKIAYFQKRPRGAGKFLNRKPQNWGEKKSDLAFDVLLPDNTFENWDTNLNSITIKDDILQTLVPIVPAGLLPPHGLHNYHIIWEVDKWNIIKAPVDPILAKRISKNMFAVLAVWDLTPIERAIIEGR